MLFDNSMCNDDNDNHNDDNDIWMSIDSQPPQGAAFAGDDDDLFIVMINLFSWLFDRY